VNNEPGGIFVLQILPTLNKISPRKGKLGSSSVQKLFSRVSWWNSILKYSYCPRRVLAQRPKPGDYKELQGISKR